MKCIQSVVYCSRHQGVDAWGTYRYQRMPGFVIFLPHVCLVAGKNWQDALPYVNMQLATPFDGASFMSGDIVQGGGDERGFCTKKEMMFSSPLNWEPALRGMDKKIFLATYFYRAWQHSYSWWMCKSLTCISFPSDVYWRLMDVRSTD